MAERTKSKISLEQSDYDTAVDLGYRADDADGPYACVRIWHRDKNTEIAKKLRTLAFAVENGRLPKPGEIDG